VKRSLTEFRALPISSSTIPRTPDCVHRQNDKHSMRKPKIQTNPQQKPASRPPGAADPAATESEGNGAPQSSVLQHALPLALGALTIFGVAGYSVGRAYLEGWYAEAGVPVLTFNWDLQYVVLRGLSADMLRLWLFEIIMIAVMIALFCSAELALTKLADWRSRRMGARPKSPSNKQPPPPRQEVRQWIKSMFTAFMLLASAGLWYGGSKLLNEIPRRQGAADFARLFQSATCVARDGEFHGELCASEGAQLGPYPWVEVHSPSLNSNVHGWLLQHQGSSVLLVSRSGVNLLTFGDVPFRVSNALSGGGSVKFSAAQRASEARPQFKSDSANAEVSRTSESAQPVAAPSASAGRPPVPAKPNGAPRGMASSKASSASSSAR